MQIVTHVDIWRKKDVKSGWGIVPNVPLDTMVSTFLACVHYILILRRSLYAAWIFF